HVAAAEQLLGAALVEDHAAVDLGADGEGPPGRGVGLDQAGDDVGGGSRGGMFALIRPVMMSVDGRWVAITRWMPTARASWAMRQISSSTSPAATIMRSASSSITMTI